MEELKKNSINVSGEVVACWPQYGDKEEAIDMTEIGSKFDGSFSMNNSTICFVVDHEVFVTPYTDKAMEAIRKARLTEKLFYVPFSNWDYPKNEAARWKELREAARETY